MTENTGTTGRQYTGEEMRALLVAGGKYSGYLNVQGAVYLLVFTDLPDWRDFATLVNVEEVHDRTRDETYTAAFVQNWAALLDGKRAARLSASGRRLLTLAVGMAEGVPVDLRENLAGFGHVGMRRVTEAMAIATGLNEFYTLTATPTPALDALLAFHSQMSGEKR